MITRKSFGEHIFDAANVVFMLFLVVVTLYPFLYVTAASLSDSNKLVSHSGILLLPAGFTLDAYEAVLKNPNILTGYSNTILIVVAGTLLNMFFTSIGAYVLSRKQVMWNTPIMLMIIFTMFFSGGLIPGYLLVYNGLHMGNSLLALIIPGLISTWNLIVMRTSFAAIPENLIESAKIDGASEFGILFKVVIPLSMPVISVMILFYGVGHWNSWFAAVIYLRDRHLFPLQLILREILVLSSTDSMTTNTAGQDQFTIGESIKYATIMVATIPILLVYPFLQKYFAHGVMVGAVKE
ncbi:MAG: sugar transporter permease [Paenibacillaceae bacterium]|jgi:putative aldouronate transport system permease protein|nr:sugar transporter permease [Paenibacillaceae bacterium]